MARRAQRASLDLRQFLTQLIPLGEVFLNVRVTDPTEFALSYVDAERRHEVATWTAVPWQEVEG
jgi:hypothetical protein